MNIYVHNVSALHVTLDEGQANTFSTRSLHPGFDHSADRQTGWYKVVLSTSICASTTDQGQEILYGKFCTHTNWVKASRSFVNALNWHPLAINLGLQK